MLALLLTTVVAALLPWARGPAPDADAGRAAAAEPRHWLRGARIARHGADGRLLMLVEAESVDWFDDRSARLTALRVSRLGGQDVWTLTAPSGHAPPAERRLMLEGPVLAEGRWPNGDPFRISAPHLWIDALRREVATDGRVVLEAPGRRIRALGMRADWDGERLELLAQVEARHALPR